MKKQQVLNQILLLNKLLLLSLLFVTCNQPNPTSEIPSPNNTNMPITQTLYPYPDTQRDSIVDNYHGTKVADPYRWLEDETAPETKQWIEAQNKLTDNYFDKIPFKESIRERLTTLWDYPKVGLPRKKGNYYYLSKNDGLQNQNVMYRQKGLDGSAQLFLDPNTFSEDGTVSLAGTSFSEDQKYFAYAQSKGGSDWRTFHIIKVDSRKQLPDTLENIKFSGMAWYKGGIFYKRYQKPTEGKELSVENKAGKIFYHKVGTKQSEDELVYEMPDSPESSFSLATYDDEKAAIMYHWQGAGNGNGLSYAATKDWKKGFSPLVESMEHDFDIIDIRDNKALIKTNKDAPKYRVILMDLSNPAEANWEVVLPEQEEVLRGVQVVGEGHLIAHYMKDVSSRLYLYSRAGKRLKSIELPTKGIVGGISSTKKENVLFFNFQSYLYPSTTFQYDLDSDSLSIFYQPKIDFNFEDYETKQVFYNSKDGTKIPMFITARKGLKLDGNNPTLVYGYGGFNVSRVPIFSIQNLPFYENGGVFAVANLRGGSEYGEDWHKAGMLEKKQNVFDDFIAAAEYLIDQKYTSPQKLAATGRSNGGLLVGAVMNQRPELFKAALPVVGVMDMLRYQKFTIGWAWAKEYGSSDDADAFPYLYAYSPYHNIDGDLPYPATMVLTAERDDRVVPAHSYKYTAELQQQYKGTEPILIRVEVKAGHGSGKSTEQSITKYTERWAFIFKELGIEL